MPSRRAGGARGRGGGAHRTGQVAETVRQVLAEAIMRDVRDPRVKAITLTAVEVSRDLGYATVRVTVGGDPTPEDRAAALAGLESAAGFLRGKVARVLATRSVPEIRFSLDRGEEHRARIESVLAELRRESES